MTTRKNDTLPVPFSSHKIFSHNRAFTTAEIIITVHIYYIQILLTAMMIRAHPIMNTPIAFGQDNGFIKCPTTAMQKRRTQNLQLQPLPPSFCPFPDTVIIGNGSKAVTNATGNQRLQSRVADQLDDYCSSGSRAEKSRIVSDIYDEIQQHCPVGAFVKLDGEGNWLELSELMAREKITATFRDLLGDKYKSSARNKVARKRNARIMKRLAARTMNVITSNKPPRPALQPVEMQCGPIMSQEQSSPVEIPSMENPFSPEGKYFTVVRRKSSLIEMMPLTLSDLDSLFKEDIEPIDFEDIEPVSQNIFETFFHGPDQVPSLAL
jgi:hypothetical protein